VLNVRKWEMGMGMPETRIGWTHKGVIHSQAPVCPHCGKAVDSGRVKFFFTVNEVEGKPVELFMHMDRAGTALDGLSDLVAIFASRLLQVGVSAEWVFGKMQHQRFEPSGMTEDEDVRMAKSVADYVGRKAESRTRLRQGYVGQEQKAETGESKA
jgi:hypothetical protein